MIRRGFWLTAGAVTGIYGYRRVSAAGRRLTASLTPATGSAATAAGPVAVTASTAGPAAAATLAGLARGAGLSRRGMIRLARETYRFSCDVREGMQLYGAEHPAAGAAHLAASQAARAGSTTRTLSTEGFESTESTALATEPAQEPDRATNLELKDGR